MDNKPRRKGRAGKAPELALKDGGWGGGGLRGARLRSRAPCAKVLGARARHIQGQVVQWVSRASSKRP